MPGTLYQRTDEGNITNLYQVEFVNKTFDDLSLHLQVEDPADAILRKVGGEPEIHVKAGDMLKEMYLIELPSEKVTQAKLNIRLGVYSGERKLETIKAKFVGPVHSHHDRVKGER